MTDQLSLQLADGRIECSFCDVIAGSEHATVVHETAHTSAFLDRRPLRHGHILVVPKHHVETLGDLPTEQVPILFSVVRLLMMAVEKAVEAHGTFIAINNRVSQSVPHLHVHVVPRRHKDGLKGFFWPRVKYDDEHHLETVASAIRHAIEDLTP